MVLAALLSGPHWGDIVVMAMLVVIALLLVGFVRERLSPRFLDFLSLSAQVGRSEAIDDLPERGKQLPHPAGLYRLDLQPCEAEFEPVA
jgi:hypothetical protein